MAENQKPLTVGPIKLEELTELVAWNTSRSWGNQIQVLLNPDHAMLILREQIAVTMESPDGEAAVATKNVASWVIPLEVAKQLSIALNGMDFEAVKNAKPDS